jgi:DNA-binding response OmpR family regulator
MKTNTILQTAAPASANRHCPANPACRILVVDDDRLIRRLNTGVLAGSGYNVDAAEDGEMAWQALNIGSYDLLITDNDMPNVSGVELLKKLCAAHINLPVIMATGKFPEEEFSQRPWLLPAATLHKPYTRAALLGAVAEVFRAGAEAGEPVALPDWQSQPAAPTSLSAACR